MADSDWQFSILGPLTVRSGGRALTPAAAKQRILLATLLLHDRRLVPLDVLVERLWDHQPPYGARRTVQAYVMRLRRSLGGATGPGQLIRTAPGGYLIDLAPGQLDLHTFRALADEAEQSTGAGALVEAADRFAAALALWRGPALADVESESLRHGEILGLTEQRLQVIERRIDVELRLGHHRDLIHELRTLVADHPLRERYWSQLILALYRSRQRADALAAYRRIDRILARDLGIDPGPELRELHRAVLCDDEQLRHPGTSGESPVLLTAPSPRPSTGVSELPAPDLRERDWPGPRQLPRDITDFVGREDAMAQITDALNAPATVPVVVLCGPPGAGKTALAVRVAHHLRSRFPDGQLYARLSGPADPDRQSAEILAELLRGTGVVDAAIPPGAEERSTVLRARLADRQVLLLLDDATSAEQVRPLLPGTAGCAVLVTSRSQLRGLSALDGARRVPVDVLSEDEAVQLLTRCLGTDLARVERSTVAQLAELCARLPLALRIAAANVSGQGPERLRPHIAELLRGDRLTSLAVAGDGGAAVRAAFNRSYADLDPACRRLFRLLGVLPGEDVTVPYVAVLLDTDLGQAGQALDTLLSSCLLQQSRVEGRYQLHNLLRLYAAELVAAEEPAELSRAAFDRFVGHLAAHADAAARVLYPELRRLPVPVGPPVGTHTVEAAMVWLNAERATLIATIVRTAAMGQVRTAASLADAVRGYLHSHRYDNDWSVASTAALEAAELADDPHAAASMHRSLCVLHWSIADYTSALVHGRRALAGFRRLAVSDDVASALNNLGMIHDELGEMPAAVRCYRLGLSLRQHPGHLTPLRLGPILNNLGYAHYQLGELDLAVAELTEAQETCRQSHCREGELKTLLNLAMACCERGELQLAEDRTANALAICRETGNRHDEAEALRTLAVICRETGRQTVALRHARQAAMLACRTANRKQEVDAVNTVGSIRCQLGALPRAYQEHVRALRLARSMRYPWGEVAALLGMADVGRRQGQWQRAAGQASSALAVAKRHSFRLRESDAHTLLADILAAQGRHERAVAHHRHAVSMQRPHGYRPGLALAQRLSAAPDPRAPRRLVPARVRTDDLAGPVEPASQSIAHVLLSTVDIVPVPDRCASPAVPGSGDTQRSGDDRSRGPNVANLR